MTKEKYHDLEDDYINHILKYVKESGGLFPHISIFAEDKDPEQTKPALIHIPIEDSYMEDDAGKERFIKNVLPGVFRALKEEFIPVGTAWASEAWMRFPGKDFDPEKDNWKEIPIKKEVIIIQTESDFGTSCVIYEIKREGKQINSDGELTDNVTLERLDDLKNPEHMSGRFSGLFNKLKKI